MNKYLLNLFQDYSFLSDEVILKNILKKLDDKKEVKEIYQDHPNFLEYIDIKDINHTISKLETNLTLIHHALEDKDHELLYHLKVINQQNQKLLDELLMMLDYYDKK